MKKRFLSLILVFALALTLAPAALAAGFADVSDAATARNVEVLRLMGVIEGDGNAAFRPYSSLTRAEFCKMAVVLAGKRGAAARYANRTVFPDVRATHWAAGYINYAASEDAGLIHGMADGTFRPDRAITYGEAVAILMRLLGYADKDTGGIWPDGYLALAGEAGMTKELPVSGGAAVTRAQAAKLFVNALTAKNDEGATLLSKLGYTVDLTADAVTLRSVDTVNGRFRLSDGTTPEMANPTDSTVLNGLRGHVVTNAAKKAVTFLPVTSAAGGPVSDAAVVVSADGSTTGFDALTGNSTTYKIYRNGVRVTAGALRRNDVAIYNASNDTVQVVDTRVTVYYENCDPSPAAPATIEVLGGTTFDVLPTAQQSLSKFRPGQTMVVLMTADGRVAGAVNDMSGNAFGYVNKSGTTYLLCGGNLIELKCSGSGSEGKLVRIGQNNRGAVSVTAQTNRADGALDLAANTVGTRQISDNVLVFKDGEQTSLNALGVTRVERSELSYVGTDSAGKVILIVIGESDTGEYYGRVVVSKANDTLRWVPGEGKGEEDPNSPTNEHYETVTGAITTTLQRPGKADVSDTGSYSVATGDFVSTRISSNGKFINMAVMEKLAAVPASAWVGDTAVNYGGRTYSVPSGVICYNRDNATWFAASGTTTALAAAKAYGGTMDLYVKDGVVRVVEVRT